MDKSLVQVLLVTDDGPADGGFLQWRGQNMPDAIGLKARHFHLGEFVRVLRETVWVGVDVKITTALRAMPGDEGEAAFMVERGADVVGFRFDEPFTVEGSVRTLADYDMALFFSQAYGNPDPKLAGEAEAIAAFMENGGGFFATGDHENFGAPLCGLIPRVRSMRRWWSHVDGEADGGPLAPPVTGPSRHDTTRPGADGVVNFEDQSDEVPQEIIPTMYDGGLTVRNGYPARITFPHPLLCSPDGLVKYLPDHMHEGWCEVPDDLESRTFQLAGQTAREYPDYEPPGPPFGKFPRPLEPEIVALGEVAAGILTVELDSAAHHNGEAVATEAKTFGVIGAWDGHRVGRGRVVVDSTWHHFFNINLTGDRYLEDDGLGPKHEQKKFGFFVPDGFGGHVPNAEYQMIMWYFRNLVYWLIPARRMRGVWWSALIDLVQRPRMAEEMATGAQRFEMLTFGDYLYFGGVAEQYLRSARGACSIYDIQRVLFEPKIPWSEWVQEIADVWSPARRERFSEVDFENQWSGAAGTGPRFDIALTVGLGVAVVSAAVVARDLGRRPDKGAAVEAVQRVWPAVLDHALGAYAGQLEIGARAGREVSDAIRSAVAEQTRPAA